MPASLSSNKALFYSICSDMFDFTFCLDHGLDKKNTRQLCQAAMTEEKQNKIGLT